MMTTEDKILLGQAINIVSADVTHNNIKDDGFDKDYIGSEAWESYIKTIFRKLRKIKQEMMLELKNE